MGRSRGGLTTKIHALTDARGLPLELILTPGQATVRRRRSCSGICAPTPSCWPTRLMTPIGCAGRSRPPVPRQTSRRWSNRRRKPCFSPALYRARNRIERFFNRIKHFRRLATRYEKHAANFLAMLKLAATHLWLRHNESVT